jgi:uncharacterized protein YkwD
MRTFLALLSVAASAVCFAADPAQMVASGINSIRVRHGLPVLKREGRLESAAKSQCLWMASVGRMDHLREAPKSYEDFLVSDYHPANRVVKSGYFSFEELFRVDKGDRGVCVVPLPAANDKVGEIVAHGAGGPMAYDVRICLNGWMNSPGHRAEILTEAYREMGVFVCSPMPNTTYWCVVFAYR